MWYVIQVLAGEEQVISDMCKRVVDDRLYNEIFIPMYVNRKRYEGSWHDELKVLFKGYIFIDAEPENIKDIAMELRKVPALTKIVKSADEMTPITDREQKFLMDMLDEDYILRVSQGMIIGDEVKITNGPLRNYSGRICKIDRHKRIAEIEVEWFGGCNTVEVGLEVIGKYTVEQYKEVSGQKSHMT